MRHRLTCWIDDKLATRGRSGREPVHRIIYPQCQGHGLDIAASTLTRLHARPRSQPANWPRDRGLCLPNVTATAVLAPPGGRSSRGTPGSSEGSPGRLWTGRAREPPLQPPLRHPPLLDPLTPVTRDASPTSLPIPTLDGSPIKIILYV